MALKKYNVSGNKLPYIEKVMQNRNYDYKIYGDKIEIGLNYSINQSNTEYVPIKSYAFTETLEITRTFKGGTTRTKTLTYDVYSVI